MKKSLLIMICVSLSVMLAAQAKAPRLTVVNRQQAAVSTLMKRTGNANTSIPQSSHAPASTGIYYPSAFSSCANTASAVSYLDDDDYYVTGSNGYGDLGSAQTYLISGTVSGIAAVLVNGYSGDDVSVPVTLYNSDFSTVLASTSYMSSSITYGSFDLYQFSFSTPVVASNFNVFVGFPDYTATSTDIVIGTTEVDCYSGLDTYVMESDGSFVLYSTYYTGFNIDLMIFPILESSTAISQTELDQLTYLYPNPSRDEVLVCSSLDMQRVEIYSLTGQKMYDEAVTGISTRVNLSHFSTGEYLVRVHSAAGIATQKLMIR